jgi:hypothetical protein
LLTKYELAFSDSIPSFISKDQISIYPFFMHSALTLARSQHPPMRCPRLRVTQVCNSLLTRWVDRVQDGESRQEYGKCHPVH